MKNPHTEATKTGSIPAQHDRYHLFWIIFQAYCLITILILFLCGYAVVAGSSPLKIPFIIYALVNSVIYYRLFFRNPILRKQISKTN